MIDYDGDDGDDGFPAYDPQNPEPDYDDPDHCRECDTWGEFQCSLHGGAYLERCREEDARYGRESGRGRRGPYWRPEAERLRYRATDDGGTVRAYRTVAGEDVRLNLAMVVGDPVATRAIALRFSRDWRRCDNGGVLAHLKVRVELP